MKEGEGVMLTMNDRLHELIHILHDIQKEDSIQGKSHLRKKALWDKVGVIMNELIDDTK